MQAHLMHNFIHYKRCTGHITGVFHQRNTEIQNQNIGQKDDNTTYTAYDTVNQHILQRPLRHVIANQVTDLPHQPFNSHHRIFSENKCSLKHQVHEKEKDRIPPDTMGNDSIQHLRRLRLLQMIVSKCLFQRTTDKTVFGIRYGGFAILVHRFLNALGHLVANTENLSRIGQRPYKALYIGIVFQQLDRQKAGRIFMADKFILGYFLFYSVNRFFQIGTMIDMDMTEYTPFPFMFAHVILQMFFLMILPVFQRIMPFGQVFQNFRIHISLLVKKINPFIKVDYYMKQGIQSTILLADSRHHRHSEQFTQQMIIQCITAGFKFIVNIQSYHHTDIHINQLGSQIQISLQI